MNPSSAPGVSPCDEAGAAGAVREEKSSRTFTSNPPSAAGGAAAWLVVVVLAGPANNSTTKIVLRRIKDEARVEQPTGESSYISYRMGFLKGGRGLESCLGLCSMH